MDVWGPDGSHGPDRTNGPVPHRVDLGYCWAMATSQLHEFARVGAEARLRAIADERQAILQMFPELADGAAPARRASSSAPTPTRKRRGMSAAERKAVGTRMRAYWAKRREEKAGGEAATADRATESSATAKRPSKRKGMSAEARKAVGQRMRAYWAARRARSRPADARERARRPDARSSSSPAAGHRMRGGSGRVLNTASVSRSRSRTVLQQAAIAPPRADGQLVRRSIAWPAGPRNDQEKPLPIGRDVVLILHRVNPKPELEQLSRGAGLRRIASVSTDIIAPSKAR